MDTPIEDKLADCENELAHERLKFRMALAEVTKQRDDALAASTEWQRRHNVAVRIGQDRLAQRGAEIEALEAERDELLAAARRVLAITPYTKLDEVFAANKGLRDVVASVKGGA